MRCWRSLESAHWGMSAEEDSPVHGDQKETQPVRRSARSAARMGFEPPSMSVEEATQCLKDMLGSEDAVEEEALRSTVSAFGGSVIAQLKNPELKALGAALQWESTTGGNSVLIPKVFAWLEGKQEAAPPTDVFSRPPTPNQPGSEQGTFYS